MKTRLAHVTNSSSASFTISLDALSLNQLQMIREHMEIAREKELGLDNVPAKEWQIELGETSVYGYTGMDNFDMEYFLTEIVEIEADDITWSFR